MRRKQNGDDMKLKKWLTGTGLLLLPLLWGYDLSAGGGGRETDRDSTGRIVLPGTDSVGCGQVVHPLSAEERLEERLAALERSDAAYSSEIDLSAGRLSLGEVFRHIAGVNGVNVCVRVNEGQEVTCNFTRVKVIDLIRFLCREYHLEVEVAGNILTVYAPAPVVPVRALPRVVTDSTGKVMSYDLMNDALPEVARLIAVQTGENIVVPQSLYHQRVSGHVRNLPVKEAIEMLARANGLDIEQERAGVWTIGGPAAVAGGKEPPATTWSGTRRRSYNREQVEVDSAGLITLALSQGNVQEVITEVAERLGVNRMFLNPLEQAVSVYVRQVDFVTMLNLLLAGTNYTYRCEAGVYVFGGSGKEKSLGVTRVIPLHNRTVDQVIELIPASVKGDMQVQLFAEQNSVIASGTSRQVGLLADFLESVDRSVPLITIDVLIVDSKKSRVQETGITAGLGKGPEKTGGTLSPGVNMSLTSSSINNLINRFNGFGSVNLGKVSPEFYVNLKALEEDGLIELRSTPRLSTLNGHEATLKSGETKYYKEVQNNIIGTQNPIQSESYIWKNVEANLSVKITPFVSSRGKITLAVEIEQSEFTAREEKDAPPGSATRSFKSQIRVDDGDMVLLGGIDRNSREKTSSGFPFLSRIPVLKWLFGQTTNNRVDEKLNVFIKPQVVY